jgi:hypothetical protein
MIRVEQWYLGHTAVGATVSVFSEALGGGNRLEPSNEGDS